MRGLNIACIPKNANSSIRRALLGPGPKGRDLYKNPALNLTTRYEAPAGTIAFIRDPFDRVLSAWADKIDRDEPSKGSQALIDLGCYLRMPFAAFCELLPKISQHDVHTMPQSWFVYSDFVLHRFEDIETVWQSIRAAHPWVDPLGTLRRRDPSATHYTERAREIVREMYADDFGIRESL